MKVTLQYFEGCPHWKLADETAQAVAPDRVGEVGRHDRVGRERVRVADVRDVCVRVGVVISVPLPRRVRSQPVAFRRLRRQRIDTEPERRQFAGANRRIRPGRKRVQRAGRLPGDVAGRRRGVVLVDVETVATTDHARSFS